MTPKTPKTIQTWVSTDHFCKGYENQVGQELAFQFVRGKSFGAYKIEDIHDLLSEFHGLLNQTFIFIVAL